MNGEYLKETEIVGDPKSGIKAIYPVSRSTWRRGVRKGIYPAPVRLSTKLIAWKRTDIQALINGTWRPK